MIAEFRFYPGGHRVARAPFKYPCIPYNLVGTGSVGFSHPDISPQVISDNVRVLSYKYLIGVDFRQAATLSSACQ